MPVITSEGLEVLLNSRGGAAGERKREASWLLQSAVEMVTAPHILLFVMRCFQVTLLDFGASRAFGTEFTDHYIEVSTNLWLLKGWGSSQIGRAGQGGKANWN